LCEIDPERACRYCLTFHTLSKFLGHFAMIIRVRTNVGVWRVEVSPSAFPQDIKNEIGRTRPNAVYEKPLSFDPKYENPIDASKTIGSQGLCHGSMIYARVDSESCVERNVDADGTGNSIKSNRKMISKDGSIKVVDADAGKNSFRKGTLALRDMKMAWTLNEFMAMDSQYEFKIKRQETSWVTGGVSLDTPSCDDFQRYLSQFQYRRSRFGYLYGSFLKEEDETKVVVECIYEPQQVADPDAAEGFEVLEDPNEERVDSLAEMLGLTKVGWIFGHPTREKDIQLTGAEIIMAAELQLECNGGLGETPFVTVKVSCGKDGKVSFEAFQASLQCMEMVAEQAIFVDKDNPKVCNVNETFTALQEGKPSKTVDCNFFLTVVPIRQHVSDTFVSQFPKANREGVVQTLDLIKKQLTKSGRDGWAFIDLLSDFSLLLFLCDFLDFNTDIPKICQSVTHREIPLEQGYQIIIASMAGMDTAY